MSVISKQKPQEFAHSVRFDVRTTVQEKADLVQAAKLNGVSTSAFVRAAVHKAAMDVISRHETTRLSAADHDAFFQAMMEPAAPTDALVAAKAAYHKLAD